MIACENSLCLFPAEVNMRAPDGSRRWMCKRHAQSLEVFCAGYGDPVTIVTKGEAAGGQKMDEDRAELVRLRARVAELENECGALKQEAVERRHAAYLDGLADAKSRIATLEAERADLEARLAAK